MANKRTPKDYALLVAKGMGMGAADVVPGVSGGTIAFISGIYEEFINSLKSVDHRALGLLIKEGPKAFWKKINGSFLLSVFGGIGISVLSLVKLIHYLLENQPVLIWSFFFGLIIASALVVSRKVTQWNLANAGLLVAGVAIAYFITQGTPAETPDELWFIFVSGAIAICAMMLPGISGSFILLLLKKYETIIGAAKDLDVTVLITFMLGCATGLVSFSHLLSWMFRKFHNATVALLTGFMLGSLEVVWPWKVVTEMRTNSKGEEVPFLYESVLPGNFTGNAQTVEAIALMLVGLVLIIWLERKGNQSPA